LLAFAPARRERRRRRERKKTIGSYGCGRTLGTLIRSDAEILE